MTADLIARGAVFAAAAVTVPLALPLMTGPMLPSERLSRSLLLPAVVLLAISFALPQGIGAAALAAPWALITVLLALAAARRLMAGLRPRPVVVASLATRNRSTTERTDMAHGKHGSHTECTERGFSCHGSSRQAPGIETRVGRCPRPTLVTRTLVDSQVKPLVSVATRRGSFRGFRILFRAFRESCPCLPCLHQRHVESVAAVLLASAVLVTAWLVAEQALAPNTPAPVRTPWLLTAACLLTSMALAIAYGLRGVLPADTIDIETMAWSHGVLNVIGPGIAGIVGCRRWNRGVTN